MNLGEFRDILGRAVPDADVKIVDEHGTYCDICGISIEFPVDGNSQECVVINFE